MTNKTALDLHEIQQSKGFYDNCLILANDIRKLNSLPELPKELIDNADILIKSGIFAIKELFCNYAIAVNYNERQDFDLILMQFTYQSQSQTQACIGTVIGNEIFFLSNVGFDYLPANRLNKYVLGCYRYNR